MRSYRLTYEARQDYFDAFDHIAEYSLQNAIRWEVRMLDAFDHLASWPRPDVFAQNMHPITFVFGLWKNISSSMIHPLNLLQSSVSFTDLRTSPRL